MSADPLSIALPSVGVFMDNSIAIFSQEARSAGISFVYNTTNLHVDERRFRTRSAWVEYSCTSAPLDWSTANTQGAIAYDPRVGSTPQLRPTGATGIVESAAGKLYRITPEIGTFKVEDISDGYQGRAPMRLAWLVQAANYIIRTDGVSNTQIWDGLQTVTSTGYNSNAPASSRLPNFAGPVLYTDRIWIVNRGNELIAGDHIHRLNLTGNTDLLLTTDQSYDLTSVSFPPPQEMGDIVSLNMVTSARGGGLASQAEIVAGTQGPGMWGVLAGTPRSQWATTSMRRVVHESVGPTGPFAAWPGKDELLMRTAEGITSLKYVSQEGAQPGNPHVNLGQEIKPLLDRDPQDLLLFASMHVSARQQRLACTVYPVTDGPNRWHRAYVTAALAPGRTRTPEAMVWEGVSTLPAAMGEIIQFVEVRDIGTKTRLFALLRKADGTKGLAEWTSQWGDDVLADGTPVPIPWQILTRRISRGGEYNPSSWGDAYLSLTGIRDKTSIEIYARSNGKDPFKQVYSNTFTNATWETSGYADAEPLTLGSIFRDFKSPWIQILIKGTGSAVVDLAIGGLGSGKSGTAPPNTCLQGNLLCQYDPFMRA